MRPPACPSRCRLFPFQRPSQEAQPATRAEHTPSCGGGMCMHPKQARTQGPRHGRRTSSILPLSRPHTHTRARHYRSLHAPHGVHTHLGMYPTVPRTHASKHGHARSHARKHSRRHLLDLYLHAHTHTTNPCIYLHLHLHLHLHPHPHPHLHTEHVRPSLPPLPPGPIEIPAPDRSAVPSYLRLQPSSRCVRTETDRRMHG